MRTRDSNRYGGGRSLLVGASAAAARWVLACAAACTAPGNQSELEIALAPTALPGVGLQAAVAQTAWARPGRVLAFEVDWSHHELDDHADFDLARAGLRARLGESAPHALVLRGGLAWARATGDPVFLDAPGDYGGGYVGVGVELHAHRGLGGGSLHLAPELVVHVLDSEGSGDAGVVPQLALRLGWRP